MSAMNAVDPGSEDPSATDGTAGVPSGTNNGGGTTAPGGDECEAPELWDFGAQGPTGGNFNPTYFGVVIEGVIEGGDVYDFVLDAEELSAYIAFDFYDANANALCSAVFDASDSLIPTTGWSTDSGGVVYEGYEVAVDPNQGWTNCANLNAGNWGTTDVRSWVAQRSIRIGIGELNGQLYNDLESAFGVATWNADWAPYVLGTYIDIGLASAKQHGFVFAYDHDCYELDSAGANLQYAPTGPVDLNGLLTGSESGLVFNMAMVP